MDVLCVGLAVCDIIIKSVSAESLTRDTSTAEIISLLGGGDAFNVAGNLARLGCSTELICGIGSDSLGTFLKEQAVKYGIGTDHMVTKDQPTSASAVLVHPNGERSFLSYKGACHALTEGDIPQKLLETAKILYVGSAFDLPGLDGEGLGTLMARAHRCGIITALDVTGEPSQEQLDILRPALKNVDLFLPSEREAVRLSGFLDPLAAAHFFCGLGPRTTVIKRGKNGCVAVSEGHVYSTDSYPCKAIDTTGAGDCFVSGFLAAYLRGMPLEECLRFGNAAGNVCVQKLGASGTLEGYEQLEELIKKEKTKREREK